MLDPKGDPLKQVNGAKREDARVASLASLRGSLFITPRYFNFLPSLYIFDPISTPLFVTLKFRNSILFNNCPFSR